MTEVPVILAAALAGLTVGLGGAFAAPERLAVGLVAGVTAAFVALSLSRPLRRDEWLPLLFLTWAGGVAIVVGLAPLAAKQTVGAWLIAWLLWISGRRAAPAGRRMAKVILAATATLLAAAVVAEWWGLRVPRAGGLLENPNVAGALLVPAALLLWPSVRGRRRWLAAVVVAVVIGAVLLTGSRAALLALAAAGVVSVPKGRSRVVVVLAAAAIVTGAIGWRLTVQRDALAWHRPVIWQAILGVAAERPVIGFGPGAWSDVAGRARITYPDQLAQHELEPNYAESSLLAVLTQTGSVGVVLVLLAGGAWWWSFARGDGSGPRARRALAVAVVVMALLHDMLQVDVVLWWWASVIGLSSPPAIRARPAHSWRQLAAALVACWAVMWSIAEPALARLRWQRAETASTEAAEHALRTEPWDDLPARQRAAVLVMGRDWGWKEVGEALYWSERAVRVHPGSSAGWATLGRVMARTLATHGQWPGTLERASGAFAHATDLEPRLPWTWLEWARLERAAGHLDSARRKAERAVEVEPAFVRGWLFLARVELDLGRFGEAGRALARANAAAGRRVPRPLTPYERELLKAPAWQVESLERALR